MKLFSKEIKAIIRLWKRNEISLKDAAQGLCAYGISPLDAWTILERT